MGKIRKTHIIRCHNWIYVFLIYIYINKQCIKSQHRKKCSATIKLKLIFFYIVWKLKVRLLIFRLWGVGRVFAIIFCCIFINELRRRPINHFKQKSCCQNILLIYEYTSYGHLGVEINRLITLINYKIIEQISIFH